jgi:16S rRNA (uracil1498-N3)-methyltransferase
MNIFYAPEIENENTEYYFSKEESLHIVKVLRKKEDDSLTLTNGKGAFFKGRIQQANPKKCEILITEKVTHSKPNYHLHIGIAPTKMNDRFEWFLEKATEIGIHEITPIFCENSERKQIKTERLEKVVIAAMKQSMQAYKPIINEAVSLAEFLNVTEASKKYIAHCEGLYKTPLKNTLLKNENSIILIGPEGDFRISEIEKALQKGYQAVSLGNSRLRTETAALVACHTVALINE